MSAKRRVFISYCHEDVDSDALEFIIQHLNEKSEGAYEILVDRINLQYGDSIPDFMALLESIDSAVILLTPAYKRKANAHLGGVHSEFSRILQRHDETRSQRNTFVDQNTAHAQLGRFELIPVILTGDETTSVPRELAHLKYLSLVGLRVVRDKRGEFLVTDHVRKTILPEIEKIVGRWQVSSTLKTKDFQAQYEELYRRLFRERKANWSDNTQENLDVLNRLFVKTDAYKQIKKQDVFFLVGRKGSGKSTVTDVLAIKLKDDYKGFIPIIANDVELESLYALFGGHQVQSDTRNIVSRRDLFAWAWELLFHICCMEILTSLRTKRKLPPHQAKHTPALEKYLKSLKYRMEGSPTGKVGIPAHFWYSFNAATVYVRKVIDESEPNDTQFYAQIRSKLTKEGFLRFAIGQKPIEALNEIVVTCQKKFLITLDGFDTKFDEFRTSSFRSFPHDLKNRSEFEVDWLSSLLLLILDIKHDSRRNMLYGLLEFCVTVPEDRYVEVRRTIRDDYRFLGRAGSLDWTGIELSMLIRKRLEMLSGGGSNKEKSPELRFEEVSKKNFSYIPYELSFSYNGHQHRLTLFAYLLRHTFWRPRDLLLHYAKIIAVADNLRRHNHDISVDMVRTVVKEVNADIIQSEFIQEFRSIISNIEAVIDVFSGKNQILPHEEVVSLLAETRFLFVIDPLGDGDVDKKIDFLYEIGFLGIVVPETLRQTLGIVHKHAFYFNEGDSIRRAGARDRYRDATFIVHPLFVEYLRLRVGSGELVLGFDWSYLRENEAIRHARDA